jgi:transcriptional regulator with XRE-family HTH domain
MLTMDQINNIRFLKRTQGKTYKEVGEITGVSYKTIKKYEELTPKIRPSIKRPTKLDPFKKEIRK